MAWAPDYVTAAELKAFQRVNDTVDDVQIAMAISAASRAVDKAAGRQFGQLAAAATWVYTAEWDRRAGRWVVSTDDYDTVTGLAVSVGGTVTTDYVKHHPQAVSKGKVWTGLTLGQGVAASSTPEDVAVTARWGWSAVPTSVKQATMLQAARFLARRDSPYGVAGSPAEGSEMRLMATVDPDVRVSLGPYVRVWAVA